MQSERPVNESVVGRVDGATIIPYSVVLAGIVECPGPSRDLLRRDVLFGSWSSQRISDNVSIAMSKTSIITVKNFVYISVAGKPLLKALNCLLERCEADGRIG